MYAIVDIETTGGFAADNSIIEIAVALHDGKEITGWFETLVNPQRPIPAYISGFTGISNQMVADAPTFKDIATRLYNFLEGRIFVAHNVNFDFSFVQRSFADCGISYLPKRLCTVRLSRKIFPGFKSYSLGNLSQQLGVSLNNAHRAGGDTRATAEIFSMLHANDADKHIEESLRKNKGELNLPPNITKKKFDKLPMSAGVYYFHDDKNKVIYVGKAINIKKRVASHFSGNNSTERKQSFLREIYDISFQLCGNELVSLLIESDEIKRLWPKYNRAQKSLDFKFGIYHFQDGRGLVRLAIERCRKYFQPHISFSSMWEARSYMDELVKRHSLIKTYCGLEQVDIVNGELVPEKTLSAAGEIEAYNTKVQQALDEIINSRECFAVLGEGRDGGEHSLVMVNEGKYAGFGFFNKKMPLDKREHILEKITRAKDTNGSYWIIRGYLMRNAGARVIHFN